MHTLLALVHPTFQHKLLPNSTSNLSRSHLGYPPTYISSLSFPSISLLNFEFDSRARNSSSPITSKFKIQKSSHACRAPFSAACGTGFRPCLSSDDPAA